jgi:SAM-dependent methyltransferase
MGDCAVYTAPSSNPIPKPAVPRFPNAMNRLKIGLRKIPVLRSLARAYRYTLDPGYRSERRLMHVKPDKLFQPWAYTAFDRHPDLFSFVRGKLPKDGALRILSYGCSTGEEVFSLRKYFPLAEIVGIDINPRSISICRRKQMRSRDMRMRFVHAATPQGESEAAYDAVFCLSVLRHGELGAHQPESCAHLIRFADFEEIVLGLCRCLKPGGYFVIVGSNFRFADTAAAADFDSVFRMGSDAPRDDTPLYDSNERKLAGVSYNEAIFRKKEAA